MRLVKLDDYQSWLFEVGGHRVLVDPWLTETFAFTQGRWLFHRGRNAEGTVEDLPPVDVVVLTAHFADHLNPETLNRFDRRMRIVGSRAAMSAVRKMGFTNTTALRPGDRTHLAGAGSIQAIAPAFPYARNAIGVLIRETPSGVSTLLEPHVLDPRLVPHVDALITTVESVRLVGLQLAMDAQRTLRAVEQVRPRYLLPTGNRPDTSGGLLSRLLSVRGSVEEFRAALQAEPSETTLVDLAPGQSISIESGGSLAGQQ